MPSSAASALLSLGLLLLSTAHAKVEYFKFEFNYDLEGMTTTGEGWRWADDASLGWQMPEGGGDYAAHTLVNPYDPPAQLYADFVPGYWGLNYTIHYYSNEGSYGNTKMALNKMSRDGQVLEVLEDLSPENTEDDYGWKIRVGYLHPGEDVLLSVSCLNNEVNPVLTDLLWGCVVDTIYFTTGDMPDIPTTEPPPSGEVEFDFEDDASDWVLGHANGAFWVRDALDSQLEPSLDQQKAGLLLSQTDLHQGTVMAQSPKMVAAAGGVQVTVAVSSLIEMSDGMQLSLRVCYSYSTCEDTAVLLLSGKGTGGAWSSGTEALPQISSGREFYLRLEGSLGVQDSSLLWVDYVTVAGASLGAQPLEEIFDLAGGLPGWTIGSMDGGLWEVEAYGSLQDVSGLPEPTNPEGLLLYVNRDQRFWAFSGVVSIESPLVAVAANTKITLMLSSWTNGGSSLRLRVKKADGTYMTPARSLEGGEAGWLQEGLGFTASADASFQFAIEADLGKRADAFIAVDSFSVVLEEL